MSAIKYILGLLLTISYIAIQPTLACTKGWKLTGYYTPWENEFAEKHLSKIVVNGMGTLSFKKAFVEEVKKQGWGKTERGWYLGYYSNNWHSSLSPLNARGTPLSLGQVAGDVNLLAFDDILKIPTVDKHFPDTYFKVTDVGSAINGMHIDIYTGEGKQAKKLSYKVTHARGMVCVDSPLRRQSNQVSSN